MAKSRQKNAAIFRRVRAKFMIGHPPAPRGVRALTPPPPRWTHVPRRRVLAASRRRLRVRHPTKRRGQRSPRLRSKYARRRAVRRRAPERDRLSIDDENPRRPADRDCEWVRRATERQGREAGNVLIRDDASSQWKMCGLDDLGRPGFPCIPLCSQFVFAPQPRLSCSSRQKKRDSRGHSSDCKILHLRRCGSPTGGALLRLPVRRQNLRAWHFREWERSRWPGCAEKWISPRR